MAPYFHSSTRSVYLPHLVFGTRLDGNAAFMIPFRIFEVANLIQGMEHGNRMVRTFFFCWPGTDLERSRNLPPFPPYNESRHATRILIENPTHWFEWFSQGSRSRTGRIFYQPGGTFSPTISRRVRGTLSAWVLLWLSLLVYERTYVVPRLIRGKIFLHNASRVILFGPGLQLFPPFPTKWMNN